MKDMQTIEQLRGKMESADELHSVVRTMKVLAAVNVRQYERAAESLDEYAHTVALGLQIVLRHESDILRLREQERAHGPTLTVFFGSDQGMVGQFNSQIVEYANQRSVLRSSSTTKDESFRENDQNEHWAISVGRRLGESLLSAGWNVVGQFDLPRSVEGILSHARDVLMQVQSFREKGAGRVILFHHVPLSGASYRPSTRYIFPLNLDWLMELQDRPWPSRMLPTFRAEPQAMFASLVQAQLLMSLYRAFAQSLAAENASRMAAMQAAEKNIDERRDRLRMMYHRQRQSKITEELLDVTAGFEASGG
jgi:F-type H+-transporting ATPase subunit gamma